MSRYTYAGPYRNPTENFYVREFVNDAEDTVLYEIWIRSPRDKDGSAPADRKHSTAPSFETAEEAQEWLDNLEDFFERDYDDYLEENGPELVRMELYELWRNEH